MRRIMYSRPSRSLYLQFVGIFTGLPHVYSLSCESGDLRQKQMLAVGLQDGRSEGVNNNNIFNAKIVNEL